MAWFQEGHGTARLAAIAVAAALALGSASPADVTVVLYHRGAAYNLAPERSDTRALVTMCEDQLRAADGSRRVRMDRRLVSALKDSELAVEISYSHPPSFVVPFSFYTLQPQRLFVPLTGEFARGTTTIFHASEGNGYSFEPYLNSRHGPWMARLQPLLVRLGIALSLSDPRAEERQSVLEPHP